MARLLGLRRRRFAPIAQNLTYPKTMIDVLAGAWRLPASHFLFSICYLN
jgi:hypothetical protein